MSRHLLVDRPNCQVVLGFDHMLRSFFGQIFDPSNRRREGIAIGGWPTRSGLGRRRRARTPGEAAEDLRLLFAWARTTQPAVVWASPAAAIHLEALRRALRVEWDEGSDEPERRIPDTLRMEFVS